jgi:hypothetical protein
MSDGEFQTLDKPKEGSEGSDGMAMLLAIDQYNHGNISIDQMMMVYEATGNCISMTKRKEIEEFKKQLDKKRNEQAAD